MRKLLLIFILNLLPLFYFAQYTISGHVKNTENETLAFSTVVIIQANDSNMAAFGMTNEDGLFKIDLAQKGDYLIQCSYVGYNTFYRSLKSDWTTKKIEIPSIKLEKSVTKLKEVNIEVERIPMGIKGDTIVYDPKAFKTRDGASVEDLLKKLPGIQVAKDGSIKAQGEDVNKVLVDGKEFFGSDPKIATKNLEAEAIDKVELFDKKSEIAEFTGVDDGKEEKTINLKLKEEYKKGAFGKLTATAGSQNTYSGKLNYNLFSTQSRLSFIGNSNNINEQAFSIQDYMDFMGGLSNLSNVSGDLFSSNQTSNRGINTGHSIGTNLNHSFTEKISLNANYFYLRNDKNLTQQITSSNFSEQNQFESDQLRTDDIIDQNHRLNSKLEWKINPFTAVSFYNNIRKIDRFTNNNSSTFYSTFNALTTLTTNRLENDEQQFSGNSRLLFKKKFKKKGRNWISDAKYERARANQVNNLSNNAFGQQLIQYQDFVTQIERQNFKSTYTEPLSKKWYASIAYTYNNDWSKPIRDFFDLRENQRIFNDSLSGNFNRSVKKHTSGINLRRNRKKIKWVGGLNSEYIRLNTTGVDRSFQYLLPNTNIQWKLKSSQNIDFTYRTSINVPTLSQLISIPNNVDPNRNYIGNSLLNPEYNHRFSIQYNFFDNFNFTSIFFTLTAEKVEDKIVNQTLVNPDFTISSSPVNTDLYEALSSFISISQPIKPLRIVYKFNGNSRWSRYNAWLNNEATEISEQNYTVDFSIERKKKEKWDYRVGVNLSLTERKYEINSTFNQRFANYSGYIDLDWEFKEDLLFTVGYSIRQYNDVFFSAKRQLHFINTSLRKSFKNDKWSIELIANDILNQTIGLNRTGTDNSLREEQFNTRAQYFMLGVSCKISQKKKKS